MPPADSRTPTVVPEVFGARLRAAREERQISVRSLARTVGVSPSLISQIENGKANPSVGTLYLIVSALEISIDSLFSEREAPASAAVPQMTGRSDRVVLRKANRPSVDLASGVRWERLTPTPDADVDFLYVTYEVGGASCPPDALMRHSGREYGLVLSGHLGATIGFETYELAPGDSIVTDSTVPHRFWTIGDEPAVLVWTVVGRAGDPRGDFRHH
jgi:transcriptional regulator with XRE-family HTH domain